MKTADEVLKEQFGHAYGMLHPFEISRITSAMQAYASQFNKPPVYKPLKEHFEMDTDAGTTLRTFDYIDALERYIESLPPSPGSVDVEEKKDIIDGKINRHAGFKVDGLGDSSGSEKEELPAVIKFLLGEGTLNGKWYGQTVAGTPFWWRKELRKLFESVKEVSREGEIAELHEKLEEITFYEEEARRQIGIRDQLLEDIFYNRLKPEVMKQKIDQILNLPF